MPKLFSPTFRISIGLVGLTTCLILSAYVLGVMPNERAIEIEARAKISEALTIQLSSAASRNEINSVQETISLVVKRNDAIHSIAFRTATGELLITAGDHNQYWVEPPDQRSTTTHVQVPIMNGANKWGKIEISFAPLNSAGQIAGIQKKLAIFIGFMGIAGFVGYYFLLRRVLRVLNPSGVIPPRIQAAFDTLVEGVMILDEQETILLSNKSFAHAINETSESLLGKKINELKWRDWNDTIASRDYPWRVAIRDQISVVGVPMGIRQETGELRSYMINATCIMDEKGVVSGAIATFDDVTAIEQQNEDLILTVQRLEETEEELSRQNHHLQYLASYDPLSGCLNRRAFFTEFDLSLERARSEHSPLCCLMVDLDHFKKINDRFGHAVGDEVIANMAAILKSSCREEDSVGRYGGEEFCVVLFGLTEGESKQVALRICQDVAIKSQSWLEKGERVTTSIGIAMLSGEHCEAMDLVKQADQALYAAKNEGRNRVVCWEEMSSEAKARPTTQSPADDSTNPANIKILDASLLRDSMRIKDTQTIESIALPRSMPNTDPSTPLPARITFMDQVSQSIVRAERNGTIVAVLYVSISSYERFAEVFGDEAGQRLISAMETRLSAILQQSDTVSLIGKGDRVPTISQIAGDKFVIEISDLEETDTVTWIIKRLLESMARPFSVNGENAYVNTKVGISIYPDDGEDAETLIRYAKLAARHTSEKNENNPYSFFSKSMNESSRQQVKLEADIRQAFEQDEFELYYQPIIDARNARVTSLEALLRCKNKHLSGTSIELLISVAEKTGLMCNLGEWVMKTATNQFDQWLNDGLDLPKLSVNVSALQLRDSAAAEQLIRIIRESEFSAEKLQIEITETAIFQDIDAVSQTLIRFQKLGVQIALDDFGTGHSSLTHLRRFRPDVLKIDRSFINEIDNSRADEALVSALIAMSHRLGLRVIGEGVETDNQMDCLRKLGCDEVQGYLIAHPMPTTAMTDWLRLFVGKDRNYSSSDNLKQSVAFA